MIKEFRNQLIAEEMEFIRKEIKTIGLTYLSATDFCEFSTVDSRVRAYLDNLKCSGKIYEWNIQMKCETGSIFIEITPKKDFHLIVYEFKLSSGGLYDS